MALVLAAAATVGLGACDSDEGDMELQCADVCNAWVDCNNSDLDRDDCADTCDEFPGGNTSTAFENCEDCVDSNACENNNFQCDTQCSQLFEYIQENLPADAD